MEDPMNRLVPVLAFACVSVCTPALADTSSPMGTWNRDDARGGVRISRCGEALCGHVTWLRDPNGPGRIGERVFYAMRPTASGTWTGMAHNPEDGRDYAGTLTLEGSRMVVKGCVLGGMVCKSMGLTRSR